MYDWKYNAFATGNDIITQGDQGAAVKAPLYRRELDMIEGMDYLAERDTWVGYDYQMMVIDLEHCREIEFTCNNKDFGIFRTRDGSWEFGMAKPEKRMLIMNCRDVHEFIKNIRIDGKTLEELWRDNDLTGEDIIHVF